MGRETLLVTLAATTLLFMGCDLGGPGPEISSTPVATPIVVGETPQASLSPTPNQMVDKLSERKQALERVKSAMERAREDFPGTTGVHFVDIESGLHLDFNGDKTFESASLMKLVVIAELYRLIQVGQLAIDHPLILERKHIVGGSGDLKDLEPGITFPVRVLAEKMITQSDNTATQMLTDFLTKEALNKSAKKMGLTGTTINRDIYDFAAIDQGRDNYITAKDAAAILEQLARDQLPGSSEIHAILERQQRNDMIGSGLPEGVRVAHKTGELNGILHDAGIVYAPNGAYVLVMLSDHVSDQKEGVKVFARLSEEVYKIYAEKSATSSPTPVTENE